MQKPELEEKVISKAWGGETDFEIAKAPQAPTTEDSRGTAVSLSQILQGSPSDTSGPADLGLVIF